MRLIKPDNYLPEELYVSKVADALSHPLRIRILELILYKKVSTRTDLCRYFKVSKVAVYNHVQVLKDANLISCYYDVHFEEMELNFSALNELRNFMDNMLENK